MPRLSRRRLLAAGCAAGTGALAGCSVLGGGGGGDDVTDRGPVEITDLRFLAAQPDGYGAYDLQPDASYRPWESVWCYVEVAGLSGEPREPPEEGGGDGDADTDGSDADPSPDRFRSHLHERLRVTDPEGGTPVDRESTFRQWLTRNQLDAFYVGNEVVLLGDAEPGEYVVTVDLTDRVSDTTATVEGTFTLEPRED